MAFEPGSPWFSSKVAGCRVDPALPSWALIEWLVRRSAASAELTRQVEKSTPAAYEPYERRPVFPGRRTWQLRVRCPRAQPAFLSGEFLFPPPSFE